MYKEDDNEMIYEFIQKTLYEYFVRFFMKDIIDNILQENGTILNLNLK